MYIHEDPSWPEFVWDSEALEQLLAGVRHKQGLLLGSMRGLGFDVRQETSVQTITSDVVKSSAIEGEHLDAREVRSSVARHLHLDAAGLPVPSRNVDAIVEMMLDATQRSDAPLSAERLFGWQAALFPTGRSGIQKITVGAWRPPEAGPMQVVSGPIGKQHVHFEAPDATRLKMEMDRFLAWFDAPPREDSVLRAGIAHFWFVTIHPFEDGNGRIARAIADMALARSDGCTERFYSMSSQIEKEKDDYYRELEMQQRGRVDITPWLRWFLGCLERAIDAADEKLQAMLHKTKFWERINLIPVNDRQRKVINLMLGPFEGYLNSSKYAKLAKCSSDTALRDIRELVERRVLVQNPGGGRSTSYRLNDIVAVP